MRENVTAVVLASSMTKVALAPVLETLTLAGRGLSGSAARVTVAVSRRSSRVSARIVKTSKSPLVDVPLMRRPKS